MEVDLELTARVNWEVSENKFVCERVRHLEESGNA